jgi:hypothetical protein
MLPVTEVKMTRTWPPADSRWMLPAERPVLAELVTSIAAKTVVEIGVNEGVTARYLLDNCPSITRYIGVEVPLHYRPAFTDQMKEVPLVPGALVRNEHSRFALMVRQRGSRARCGAARCGTCALGGSSGRFDPLSRLQTDG